MNLGDLLKPKFETDFNLKLMLIAKQPLIES